MISISEVYMVDVNDRVRLLTDEAASLHRELRNCRRSAKRRAFAMYLIGCLMGGLMGGGLVWWFLS